MSKMTKGLLYAAVAGLVSGLLFVTGVVDAHGVVTFYILLPAGAIFLGLFMISLVLEKETALFDQEHSLAVAATSAPLAPMDARTGAGKLTLAKTH